MHAYSTTFFSILFFGNLLVITLWVWYSYPYFQRLRIFNCFEYFLSDFNLIEEYAISGLFILVWYIYKKPDLGIRVYVIFLHLSRATIMVCLLIFHFSYGPCQTPTLGFCVQRYLQITSFKPEKFWALHPYIIQNGYEIKLEWERHKLFDLDVRLSFLIFYCNIHC